jgi:cobalt-zinc-cadmium resistance protein CzcA
MVVIGGLITATALTLLVLPAISQLVLGFAARRSRTEPQPTLSPAE